MKSTKPGSSSRTPFKHWMLNAELGRQVGILAIRPDSVPCSAKDFLIIDMCAGSGAETEFSDMTSVSIIQKHQDFRGLNSKVVFIEKQSGTFSELENNILDKPCTLKNMDAKNYIPEISNSKQAVFINCDPNSVDQIPITDEFMNSLPVYTTMIITLGCNVGGQKMLVLERRKEWYEYINISKRHLYRSHDLLISSINRDASQWAYLVRIPTAWSKSTQAAYLKKGNSQFENGVEVFSWRRQPKEFNHKLDVLFLTRQELKDGIT